MIDLTPEALAEVLGEEPYEAYTQHTITDLDGLYQVLARIRQKEVALNDEELILGVRTVAAPVRNDQGEIVASINISAPSTQKSCADLENRVAEMVLDSARRISEALGSG